MFTFGEDKRCVVFFSRNDGCERQRMMLQPKRKAKHIGSHRIHFAEIAGTVFVFFTVVKNTIPVKNKCFDVLQFFRNHFRMLEKSSADGCKYFFDAFQ